MIIGGCHLIFDTHNTFNSFCYLQHTLGSTASHRTRQLDEAVHQADLQLAQIDIFECGKLVF